MLEHIDRLVRKVHWREPWQYRAGPCGALALLLCGSALATACGSSNSDAGENHVMDAGADATHAPRDSSALPPVRSELLDLVLVIDNSISMGDKQRVLASSIEPFLGRLANPRCVSPTQNSIEDATCPEGTEREFKPFSSIQIAVITSSLGAHGGQLCSPTGPQFNLTQNDRAHVLGSVREGLPDHDGSGFLLWDPDSQHTPPGEVDADALVSQVAEHITAAGVSGCGYEATLEAWYRFLVDPDPAEDVAVELDEAVQFGTDSVLLDQRERFLRNGSAVGIVMLTDENDCSIRDEGVGWLTTTSTAGNTRFEMFAATEACETDPNSACCRSCALGETTPPTGCTSLDDDPSCVAGREAGTDELSLRCFDTKRRFGWDLLYDTERYVTALSSLEVTDRDGEVVSNPLFVRNGQAVRNPEAVFLLGLIGVPWQDVVTAESLAGGDMALMTASQLESSGRWDLIVGDPDNDVPPADPLMIESPAPREGANPVTGDALVGAESLDPSANPINGHEYSNPRLDDLQYACIFPLPEPVDCLVETGGCSCTEEDVELNRPVCNPPGGGPAGTTQFYGRAYPGLRHLEVLKGLGDRAIVSSVCPVRLDDPSEAGFGYTPALTALITRLGMVAAP